ncbi:hypothetical protein HAX54_019636 [Datura stramonium]|uniref:Uncharacterized protein n=1 Tax=Datura stramonium TaxID=4076 RepID=A0ABS8UQB5_DATST|nr:hypothetical protein [Datura stramonium]
MENHFAGPSMVNVLMEDEPPPSTQEDLPFAVSETTPVPQSSETPTANAPIKIPCEEGVGQEAGIADAETSKPNLKGVTIMDDTSGVKDVEDDYDDDVERRVEEFNKKNKTSKKGERKEQAPTYVDVEVSSDEKNNSTEPDPMSEGPTPKRKRG